MFLHCTVFTKFSSFGKFSLPILNLFPCVFVLFSDLDSFFIPSDWYRMYLAFFIRYLQYSTFLFVLDYFLYCFSFFPQFLVFFPGIEWFFSFSRWFYKTFHPFGTFFHFFSIKLIYFFASFSVFLVV